MQLMPHGSGSCLAPESVGSGGLHIGYRPPNLQRRGCRPNSDSHPELIEDAIEDTPEEAENLKLRSALMVALKAHLARSNLTQAQIAKLFGVTQPRVSDLLRGKLNVFGLDALVNMAAAAGLRVKISIREAAYANS